MKDTLQLSAFANHQFALGHSALLINEGLVLKAIEDIKKRFDLKKSVVGLLGMAFKPESDDIRSSLSYKFKKLLAGEVRGLLCTDPFVPARVDPGLLPLEQVIRESDLLVLCTPHMIYKSVPFQDKPVYDVWGCIHHSAAVR